MSVRTIVRLIVLAAALAPASACVAPPKGKTWAEALKVSTDDSKRYHSPRSQVRPGPGLISGKDGFVIMQVDGPGSSDPDKPVKVRR